MQKGAELELCQNSLIFDFEVAKLDAYTDIIKKTHSLLKLLPFLMLFAVYLSWVVVRDVSQNRSPPSLPYQYSDSFSHTDI